MKTITVINKSLHLFKLVAALLILNAILPFAVRPAKAIEDKIVYIECKKDGKTSYGSGVVVSADGHVLTARHVVPENSECAGAIGVADRYDLKLLNLQPQDAPGFDAKLLRFAQTHDYSFAEYCPYNQLDVRKKIFVAGFPGKTETGAPSYREGILSTISLNSNGVIETDSQTVGGMSGGPVFSQNLNGIVGIVSGAKFAANGAISYYGILPVSSFAAAFNLQVATAACYKDISDLQSKIDKLERQIAWLESHTGKHLLSEDKLEIKAGDETISRLNSVEAHIDSVASNFRWSGELNLRTGDLHIQYKKLVGGDKQHGSIGLLVNGTFHMMVEDIDTDTERLTRSQPRSLLKIVRPADLLERTDLSPDGLVGSFIFRDFKAKILNRLADEEIANVAPGINKLPRIRLAISVPDEENEGKLLPVAKINLTCELQECLNL